MSKNTEASSTSRKARRNMRRASRIREAKAQAVAKLQKPGSSTDQGTPKLSFFDLAPEIRNEVYEQLFPPTTKFTVRSSSFLSTRRLWRPSKKTVFSVLRLSQQTRYEAAGIVAKNAHCHLIIDAAFDLSSLPAWLRGSVRTFEVEGFLLRDLPAQLPTYVLGFSNVERIIAATYMVNRELAYDTSQSIPETDTVAITQSYFDSIRSRKGKPLRMQDLEGNLMESVPERVRKIIGPAASWPADRKYPTIEITVYFVNKWSPTGYYSAGMVATYDVATRTVTSASTLWLFRENPIIDLPEITSPNTPDTDHRRGGRDPYGNRKRTMVVNYHWTNPKGWLYFSQDQYEEFLRKRKWMREYLGLD